MALVYNGVMASPYGKGVLGGFGPPMASDSGILDVTGRSIAGGTRPSVAIGGPLGTVDRTECRIKCGDTEASTSCRYGMRCCKQCKDGNPEVGCIDSTQTCEDVLSPADLDIGIVITA